MSAYRNNKFQTHGALIGGPKSATDAGNPDRLPYEMEGWNDWRTDWVAAEQTLDYNAAWTVALAASLELPKSFWTGTCGGAAPHSNVAVLHVIAPALHVTVTTLHMFDAVHATN